MIHTVTSDVCAGGVYKTRYTLRPRPSLLRKKKVRHKKDTGITLTETLAALTIALILVGSITYLVHRSIMRSDTAVCASNIRNINLALSMYTADNDNTFPPVVSATFVNHHTHSADTWRDLVVIYLDDQAFPHCPQAKINSSQKSSRRIDVCGYALNERLSIRRGSNKRQNYSGKAEGSLADPALIITVFDARAGILALRGPDTATHQNELRGIWRTDMTAAILSQQAGAERHDGRANYGFEDGHISWLMSSKIRSNTSHEETTIGTEPSF
jgi:prepilin-type processing-associated H-X9-DG protein